VYHNTCDLEKRIIVPDSIFNDDLQMGVTDNRSKRSGFAKSKSSMKSFNGLGIGKVEPNTTKKFNRMTSMLDSNQSPSLIQSKVGNALMNYFNNSTKNLGLTNTSNANSSKGF
jgi:hypothetical protein